MHGVIFYCSTVACSASMTLWYVSWQAHDDGDNFSEKRSTKMCCFSRENLSSEKICRTFADVIEKRLNPVIT